MPFASARAWADRNILLLLQGHFVSKLGSALFDIALVLWLKQHSGSAGAVGIIMMLVKLPEILLSPLSGTIVDMMSRKRVLVFSDLIVGCLITGIGAACFLIAADSGLMLALVIGGAVCIGVCDSFFNPAVSSLIPQLTARENLQAVNSVYRLLTSAATFIGQSAAGLLFTVLGAPLLFLVNGLSYLFSAGSEVLIAAPAPEPREPGERRHPARQVIDNLRAGMGHVWKDKALKDFLLVICLYHFFISPFTVTLPFYVSDVLKAGPAWYGYIMAGFGVGLLTGFSVAGMLRGTGSERSRVVLSCFGLSAVSFLLIGVVHHVAITLALVFLIGGAIAIIVVTLNTIIQLSTPGALHGRVFGLYNTLSNASIPLGMGFFGIVLDGVRPLLPDPSMGPAMVFLGCGVILCLVAAFMSRRRSFREVLAGAA